jgi:Leucine-rich repeat (LRR) protein
MDMKSGRGIASILLLVFVGAGCSGAGPASTTADTSGTVVPSAPVSARRLDLSASGLDKVPSYVFDRTDLEELDLSGNRLTGALPSQIQRLKKLRVLDASGNRMTGVPAEIGQLPELTDLDLSENELTGLPFELGNLQKLRRLDLRGNDVSKQDLDGIRVKLKGTEILE